MQGDAILAMKAIVDRRPGAEEVNLIVNELIPLDDLSARFSNGVVIRVREDTHGPDIAREASRDCPRLSWHRSRCKLRLELAEGGSVVLDCAKSGVTLDPELRRRVEDLLGPGNFKLVGSSARSASPGATNGRRPAMARS